MDHESGVEGVSRDLPRVIDANRQGEIPPSWHIKPSDGSVGGAPEAVRQSVLTEVLPHDRAREIDSLGVGSFEGTVRRGAAVVQVVGTSKVVMEPDALRTKP